MKMTAVLPEDKDRLGYVGALSQKRVDPGLGGLIAYVGQCRSQMETNSFVDDRD